VTVTEMVWPPFKLQSYCVHIQGDLGMLKGKGTYSVQTCRKQFTSGTGPDKRQYIEVHSKAATNSTCIY